MWKKFFPIFQEHPDLIFLDSGASAQKPQQVLDAVQNVYSKSYANIHRGLYSLSLEATELFDEARREVASFFGALPEEIVFTKNGTEAANLFAVCFGEKYLQAGDEIVLTLAEHHANFVPWLQLREKKNIVLKFVEPDQDGVFTLEDFEEQISARTKLIAFPHVSNVTGQIFPISEIVNLAKNVSAYTFLDACQSAPHFFVDFKNLGVDAAFFTGHKMGAPGGTGGLYCQKELLENLPPFLLGGDMVDHVSTDGFSTQQLPQKFEAGTPAIAETIGLKVACEFLAHIGLNNIRTHEKEILEYALETFQTELPNFRILGPQNGKTRSGLISFAHPKIHPHDISQFLDTKNICVRSGLHCAEPIQTFLGLPTGSVRASVWMYNEKSDIDALVSGVQEAEQLFS